MNIGDTVKLTKIPDGVPSDNHQLQTLFRNCVGKTFKVAAIDDDLFELHVGEVFGKPADHHQIWVDAAHLKKIEV
jgi:hypothetical protein